MFNLGIIKIEVRQIVVHLNPDKKIKYYKETIS